MKYSGFQMAKLYGLVALGCGGILPVVDSSVAAFAQARASVVLPSQMAVNDCISKEGLQKALPQDNQRLLIVADAIASSINGDVKERNAFSSNSDFSLGYHFVQKSNGDYCKAAALFSIKLFNALSGQVDQGAYLKPVSNAPQGSLNYAINSGYNNFKEVPMFQASSEDPQTHQKILITITVNQPNDPDKKGSGSIIMATASGRGYAVDRLAETDYSQTALDFLNRTAPH